MFQFVTWEQSWIDLLCHWLLLQLDHQMTISQAKPSFASLQDQADKIFLIFSDNYFCYFVLKIKQGLLVFGLESSQLFLFSLLLFLSIAKLAQIFHYWYMKSPSQTLFQYLNLQLILLTLFSQVFLQLFSSPTHNLVGQPFFSNDFLVWMFLNQQSYYKYQFSKVQSSKRKHFHLRIRY